MRLTFKIIYNSSIFDCRDLKDATRTRDDGARSEPAWVLSSGKKPQINSVRLKCADTCRPQRTFHQWLILTYPMGYINTIQYNTIQYNTIQYNTIVIIYIMDLNKLAY